MKGVSNSEGTRSVSVVLLMFAVAVVGSNGLLLSPILANVAFSLAASPESVALAMSAYGGGTAISALLLAPLIDRHGASSALKGGLLAILLALLGSGFAANVAMLIAAQALAGIGAGLVLPSAYALATKYSAPEYASQALGRVLMGWSLSLVAGIPLSAFITEHAGWRIAYFCLAISAVIILGCAYRLPKDLTTEIKTRVWITTCRAIQPPGVLRLLAIGLAFTSSFYGVYAFVVQAVHEALRTSTAQAGIVVLVFGLGFASATAVNHWVSKIGPWKFLPWLLIINASIYLGMTVTMFSFIAFLPVAFGWGFANHLTLNSIVLLLSQSSTAQRGAILGLNSATTYAGLTVGTAAAGVIYPVAGFDRILLVAAAVQIVAALLAFFRGKTKS